MRTGKCLSGVSCYFPFESLFTDQFHYYLGKHSSSHADLNHKARSVKAEDIVGFGQIWSFSRVITLNGKNWSGQSFSQWCCWAWCHRYGDYPWNDSLMHLTNSSLIQISFVSQDMASLLMARIRKHLTVPCIHHILRLALVQSLVAAQCSHNSQTIRPIHCLVFP